MTPWNTLVASLCLAGATAAGADTPRLPAQVPKAWRSECASCHVAYPPGLLTAPGWQQLMGGLAQHFGTDASLSAAEVAEIGAFLNQQAATRSRHDSRANPPRITQTEWFERKHREVPRAVWADTRVRAAANCAACHTRADADSYREREIRVPGLEGKSW